MTESARKSDESQVCPYLGLRDDPETALYYPSPLNHCTRAKPAAPVKSEYQGSCCLTAAHSECTVYQKDPGFPLPHELRQRHPGSAHRKRSKFRFWAILLVLGIVGLILWQGYSRGLFRFAGWEGPTGGPSDRTPTVVPALFTRTSTPTSLPPSPSPTWTVASSTPTPAPFHALETPIGMERQFVIHRVLDGESLELIANHYFTTVEAIQQINYNLTIPLAVNSLIIVPFHQFDVRGYPVFEAYMVTGDSPVEDLAQQLMVDPAVFMLYNDLQDGQVLIASEWVLVPHMGTATPQP